MAYGIQRIVASASRPGVERLKLVPQFWPRAFVFWFHSYDALHEKRASVHVGKGSQDDYNDAKIWLEPAVEVARLGRTLRQRELNRALNVIKQNRDYLLEQWYGYKGRAD